MIPLKEAVILARMAFEEVMTLAVKPNCPVALINDVYLAINHQKIVGKHALQWFRVISGA